MRSYVLAIPAIISLCLSASAAPPDRIAGAVDASRVRALPGTVHQLARQSQYDRGAASPNLQLDHVVLYIRPSVAQQKSLDRLLVDQQNPSSPNYRKWLTPEEYADRFGLSPRDHAKIAAWMQSAGLSVQESSRGRNWISFAGSAAQVSQALHTSIHTYSVNGRTRFGNATEASVPESIADLVSGIAGLNNFKSVSNAHLVPDYTSASGAHYLSPADWATIYNVKPLYSAGFDGTGQSIAVVGESDIVLSDIRGFRSDFGLTALDPKLMLYGTDPGFNDTQLEANLDIEWSGGIAQKATIYYVYGENAFVAYSVAVSGNVAPVVSISFGGCEADNLTGAYRTVAQQGNAQGITTLAASGDSGGGSCDIQGDQPVATHGQIVQFPSDLPEVTGVGGTSFNEGSGTYWATANSLVNGTALSYIPEMAWNESSLAGGLGGTGGGASRIFPKPLWQTGPGVPADGARDVPDLALSAAGHDAYLITYNSGTGLFLVAGTSAAAPSMAGIVALMNQYQVKQGFQKSAGLGNINPQLYRLAQQVPAAFHDITVGDNLVLCEQGTQDCLNGTVGYSAGPGYDLATGLGSIDANVLVTSWHAAASPVTVTLSSSASKITLNDTVTITATVSAGAGQGAPTGTVSFVAFGNPLGTVPVTPSADAATAVLTVPAWMLGRGTSSVYAVYSGDATFSSAGASVRVQVTLPTTVNTAAVVPTVSPNPVFALQSGTQAPTWQVNVTLSELAGVPALLTGFTLDGQAQSLSQYFPSTSIPAGGTLKATIVLRNLSVPATHVLGFSGVDAGGAQWSRQVPVQFVGGYNAGLDGFNLWASPLSMQQNTAAPSSCQWSQLITLDGAGFEQTIVALARGSVDISTSIPAIFGTTHLQPWGSVQGTVCWSNVTPPATDLLFIETADDFGDLFAQEINVSFAGPPPAAIQLSASPASLSIKPPTIPGFGSPVSFTVGLSDPKQPWTAAIYPANETTAWLQLSQYSGVGPATITLQANAAGFEPGAYKATIVLQSALALPEAISIPVMWVNSGSPSGTSVTSAVNALSFTPTASPGMLMAIYGSQLANTTMLSASALTYSLAGVSATVNGWPAPLLYVSPGQLNIQVPFEAGSGPAVLGIDNNGQIAGFMFNVAPSAPGIVTVNGAVSPSATATQGTYATLYVTGVGDVSPAIPTGIPVTTGTALASLPRPLLPLTVTVAGTTAIVQFAGFTPGIVGLAQVNFLVPAGIATGVQPVVVTVNGVASAPANITVTPGP